MRSLSIALVTSAFVVACADNPSAPLLQPEGASFDLGKAPPPWALIQGTLETDAGDLSAARFSRAGDGGAAMAHSGNTATYRAWLLVTPGSNVSILRFATGGTNVTFSNGAMIKSVNGKVTGAGTMTVGGHTYELSAVTDFTANGECASTPYDTDGPSCASFSADDGSFSSQGAVWTGVLSNDPDGAAALPGCAANPDFVVTNPTELSAALAAVGAGGTVAINGVIAVSSAVVVQASDIRLTCATPGSGLISADGSPATILLRVAAHGVQVDNLFLSGVPSIGVGGVLHPVYAVGVQRLRVVLNQIRCGNNGGTCAFLIGSPGAVVSDNSVQSLGTGSGIHIQAGTDNTVVERNHVAAPGTSGSPLFGAIRVRDGSNLVVRHNSTSGAWRNGLALTELDAALVENNTIRGALDHGIITSTTTSAAPLSRVSLRRSIIRGNRIDGAQAIGINMAVACWNRVEANDITVATGTLRARFEASTGANVYTGASPARVVDAGAFDCDEDGKTDPNTIAGSGGKTSQVSAARIPAAPSRGNRAPSPSDGQALAELQ